MRPAAQRTVETLRDSGPLWTASLVADRLLPFGGVLGLWPDWRVAREALARQLGAVLRAWGMSDEHVGTTVDHILYADMHGIDSHGCAMLLHYHRLLRAGALNPRPAIEVVRESETTALVDGGGGLGHVPGDVAMRLAIAKCREAGVGAVAVRNSGHFGAAGLYAGLAAEAGFLGVATTNTREPSVVPTFGAGAALGTNPVAVAAPAARNRPFLLDMATSAASLGRAAAAWRKGRRLPAGWALDARGRTMTRARQAVEQRRLTPLGSRPEAGSHKGYGLAAAVEVLSAVLPGLGSERDVGHFFLAVDPSRFREPGEFESDLDALMDSLRSTRPIDPRRPVLVAGDPERAAYEERTASGIPLPRAVVEDLRAVARASGVAFTLAAA